MRRTTLDIIQEIADVRQRRRFGKAMPELIMRLFALEQAFKNQPSHQDELINYFPVALIACLEGYFRMAIKDLVDAGEPFLSNAEKPASSIKIDFSILRAVHGRTITVGELVSHGVKLSRLDHVDAALSHLLGNGFLDVLRTVSDRWEHEVKGEERAPILQEPDKTFADVSRMFELRHIICHEIPSAYEISREEIERCFESCASFLRAADELLSESMNPGAPLTQTAMNIAAGESLENKQKELAEAISSLETKLDEKGVEAFRKSQDSWVAYSEAWADFVADESASGGTIWPVIHAGSLEQLTVTRISKIREFRKLSDSP
ncbi:lysozyme inhibitor LprI family protein [Salinisphaera sp. Q1T1-3]|uniref:lysozyme inhibitor LprI family protein n=1 Tax=Salinisphaera sp. Q1T1-3 TaxID=2321229 RepID=UPI000E72890A|nr:lysozyme inhibitor LprI family protein [Salinisphaera sp. Q1T1-3]RJS91988.1 DUF1311 domain-containing protein [Salinisphaera sp. Q1T1-3]